MASSVRDYDKLAVDIIKAVGGKENIVSCEAKTSRLIVVLNDYSKMNEEKLKSLGWKPKYNLSCILSRLIEYLRE